MHILWLDGPRCHDPQLVGGKAAQIGCLAADFDVPYGFCVPAPTFAHRDVGDSLPASLQAAITASYQALASYAGVAALPVAVRSSASASRSGCSSHAACAIGRLLASIVGRQVESGASAPQDHTPEAC